MTYCITKPVICIRLHALLYTFYFFLLHAVSLVFFPLILNETTSIKKVVFIYLNTISA